MYIYIYIYVCIYVCMYISINSYTNYANVIWCSTFMPTVKKVCSQQKHAIRINYKNNNKKMNIPRNYSEGTKF